MTSALTSSQRRTVLVVDAGHHSRSRTAALADALDRACLRHLRDAQDHRDEWAVVRLDLRDHGHDLLDALVLGHRSDAVEDIVDSTWRADALVLVTPCHNASLSALAKLYLDALPRDTLAELPVAIAVAGASARHTLVGDLVVRPLLTTLGARPVPTCVYAADEDWLPSLDDNTAVPQVNSALTERIGRAARDVAGAVDEIRSTSRLVSVGSPRQWHKGTSLAVSQL